MSSSLPQWFLDFTKARGSRAPSWALPQPTFLIRRRTVESQAGNLVAYEYSALRQGTMGRWVSDIRDATQLSLTPSGLLMSEAAVQASGVGVRFSVGEIVHIDQACRDELGVEVLPQ